MIVSLFDIKQESTASEDLLTQDATLQSLQESDKAIICTAYENGIIQGTGKGIKPFAHLSRAEVAAMMCSAMGTYLECWRSIKDVDDQLWYFRYISTAMAREVFSTRYGYFQENELFYPNNLVTYGEFLQMLYNIRNYRFNIQKLKSTKIRKSVHITATGSLHA